MEPFCSRVVMCVLVVGGWCVRRRRVRMDGGIQRRWPLNPLGLCWTISLSSPCYYGLHGGHYRWMVVANFSPAVKSAQVTRPDLLYISYYTPPLPMFHSSASTSHMSGSGSAALLVHSPFVPSFYIFCLHSGLGEILESAPGGYMSVQMLTSC